MTETEFLLLKSRILQMLSDGLDSRLTYHSRSHTEDVLQQAERIAISEKITGSRELLLIKTAALFHDTGFLFTYKDHEVRSCQIMEEMTGIYDFDEDEHKKIRGMIMATKVPQNPASLFEMILCDADLDYLGRDDFALISQNLKREFMAYGVVADEEQWDKLQVNFFENHGYFTSTSLDNRQPVKQQYLEKLKQDQVTRKL